MLELEVLVNRVRVAISNLLALALVQLAHGSDVERSSVFQVHETKAKLSPGIICDNRTDILITLPVGYGNGWKLMQEKFLQRQALDEPEPMDWSIVQGKYCTFIEVRPGHERTLLYGKYAYNFAVFRGDDVLEFQGSFEIGEEKGPIANTKGEKIVAQLAIIEQLDIDVDPHVFSLEEDDIIHVTFESGSEDWDMVASESSIKHETGRQLRFAISKHPLSSGVMFMLRVEDVDSAPSGLYKFSFLVDTSVGRSSYEGKLAFMSSSEMNALVNPE